MDTRFPLAGNSGTGLRIEQREIQMDTLSRPITLPPRVISPEVFNLELSVACDLFPLEDKSYLCGFDSRNARLKVLWRSIIAAAETYSEQLDGLTVALGGPPS